MIRTTVKLLLLVLLALQLVFGVQSRVANAAVHSPATLASAAAYTPAKIGAPTIGGAKMGAHCPMGTDSRKQAVPTDPHDGASRHAGGHDCCRASGCQCVGAYTPSVVLLPLRTNIVASAKVPPLSSGQILPPPIDEVLRPPIG